MANSIVTFTLPESTKVVLVAAICSARNYAAEIPDPDNPGQTIPNPVTPDEFTANDFVNYGQNMILAYVAKMADATRVVALNDAQAQMNANPVAVSIQ